MDNQYKIKKKTQSESDKNTENSLTTIAYNNIKNDIMTNKFASGECISGSKLAQNLKMSRTPIREALNILANEGLIEIRNGVGVTIKKITKKDILELYEVRLALECVAIETLIRNKNQSGLLQLKNEWNILKNKLVQEKLSDWNEIVSLDYQTHHFIITSCGNSFLTELFENIEQRIRRIQYLSVFAQEDKGNVVEQHLELLENIIQNKTLNATNLLRKHVQVTSLIFSDNDIADKLA